MDGTNLIARLGKRWALAAFAGGALALAMFAGGERASGGTEPPGVVAVPVGTPFANPVYAAFAPDEPANVYVVERGGTVQVLAGEAPASLFLDIDSRVRSGGEEGLLSIAFHPNFAQNRLFYAYYTNNEGNIQIDEFRAISGTEVDDTSRRRVLVARHPVNGNHNGGTIAFGPDGFLYAATGDGGSGGDPLENAQDRESLLGKILRINPRRRGDRPYTSPASNPFVGRPGRNEIYARGLRNPYRFSFDAATGRIAIGDVGQAAWEEVDYEGPRTLRAANFGWDRYEGLSRFDADGDDEARTPRARHHDRPIHVYPHAGGGCAVTGGVVVRDGDLPSLEGRYLYGDFCQGELRSFVPSLDGATDDRSAGVNVGTQELSSLVRDPVTGTVYGTELDSGDLFRLAPTP